MHETYDDHIIASGGDSDRAIYSVPYTMDEDGNVTFAEQSEWTEVSLDWVSVNEENRDVPQFVQITVNSAASREETVQGRDYVVIPAVTAKGVMNKIFYPGSELQKAIPTCNGRTVTISHPKNESGSHILANTPAVESYGKFYNGFVQDGALSGEIWLDKDLAMNHGEEGELIVNSALNGEQMNVSWGFIADLDPTPGEYNGEAYNGVAINIRGDHLALLPNERGACSVEKGCGTNLTNSESEPGLVEAIVNGIARLIPGLVKEDTMPKLKVNEEADEIEVEVTEEETVEETGFSLSEDDVQRIALAVRSLDQAEEDADEDEEVEEEVEEEEVLEDEAGESDEVVALRQSIKDDPKFSAFATVVDTLTVNQLKDLAESNRPADMAGAGAAGSLKVNKKEYRIKEMPKRGN